MINDTQQLRRSAIVTGSNRGIGRAVVLELARAGFDVCVNCSSEQSLASALELVRLIEADCGVKAIAIAANVAEPDQAQPRYILLSKCKKMIACLALGYAFAGPSYGLNLTRIVS